MGEASTTRVSAGGMPRAGRVIGIALGAGILLSFAPVAAPVHHAAWAATETAAKPEKPKRRLSNSPDNIKKRECDGKWKVFKKENKPSGWKPYFTFMANCM